MPPALLVLALPVLALPVLALPVLGGWIVDGHELKPPPVLAAWRLREAEATPCEQLGRLLYKMLQPRIRTLPILRLLIPFYQLPLKFEERVKVLLAIPTEIRK